MKNQLAQEGLGEFGDAAVDVRAGLNVEGLQRLMGHGNIPTTLRYVHWLPSVRAGGGRSTSSPSWRGQMLGPSVQAVMAACLDGHAETHRLSPRHWQVRPHIVDCCTAALGGLRLACNVCGTEVSAYHSCRDRYCPRCQRRPSLDWCERWRAAVLLPVTYHHLSR